MASLIITGGAGFIGANFTRYWRAAHPDDAIVVLDALTYAGNRASLDGIDRSELVCGDIRDRGLVARLIAEREADTIVNFAAETHVDRSIAAPDAIVSSNVVGTHSVLEAARAAWLDSGSGRPHRFHHISTDEVYGSLGPADQAFTESSSYAPNSPYSASKAAADHLVRAYLRTYGLEATVSICPNNYGPLQHPEKLVPLFLLNALFGQPLPVYGNGSNVREWMHVEDHCRGIAAVLERGRAGQTYNLGSGTEMTNLTMAGAICRAVDGAFAKDHALSGRFPDAPAADGRASEQLIRFVADRKGHDFRYAIDDRKARGELGWAPQIPFSDGLQRTLQWYLANEAWWRPLVDAREA